MASQSGRSTSGLIDRIRAEPYRFEFFQLVRLLRLHYSRAGRIDPRYRPLDDPLRFRSLLSLNFPASEVSALHFESPGRVSAKGEPLTDIQVTFMGLVGPSGVLPRPYTEMLINRHVQYRDDAAHTFFDLFLHRVLSLFYEAWQKYKFHLEFERTGSSAFETRLLNLLGFSSQARTAKFAKGHSSLRQNLFSYFSGLLAQRPRNALNLETLLGFYFALPIHVRTFSGRWLKLDDDQCSRLGRDSVQLGKSAVIGRRVWDYQSCLRIEIGPLELDDYHRFQPGQPDYRKIVEIVRFYLGAELDFEIAPLIRREAVPSSQLQRNAGIALGWLGWLKSPQRELSRPVRAAVFHVPYDGVSL